jgi:hypothetical protein
MDNLMKKEHRVAVYGSNLVMSTIGKSLQERTQFQVHQLDKVIPDMTEIPGGARPDVIVFDLVTAPGALTLSWMRKHPAPIMIGVDIENSQMLVLSGLQSRLLTTDDLVQAIEEGIPNPDNNVYTKSQSRLPK